MVTGDLRNTIQGALKKAPRMFAFKENSKMPNIPFYIAEVALQSTRTDRIVHRKRPMFADDNRYRAIGDAIRRDLVWPGCHSVDIACDHNCIWLSAVDKLDLQALVKDRTLLIAKIDRLDPKQWIGFGSFNQLSYICEDLQDIDQLPWESISLEEFVAIRDIVHVDRVALA